MQQARRSLLALGAMGAFLPDAEARVADGAVRQQSIAGWRRRIESILARHRTPIVDLQATFVAGSTNLSRVMAYMDELDIAQTAFAVAAEPNGRTSVELHRQHPDYFIPATNSGEFARWWNNPLAFLEVVRQDLETGLYFFMGEHEFRHYPSPEQAAAGMAHRDITVPIDGPAGEALFRLSAQFGVAFQIHYEIEDVLLPALERVLSRHPKALPIWCHLGMIRYPQRTTRYSPEYVQSLIERFPGLHFDLAVPPPWFVYRPSGHRDSTLFGWDGRVRKEWLDVLEKYPERFLAASDYRPAVEDHIPAYVANVQRKLILGSLSERARHLAAYGNAWRLVTGEAWR